MPKSKDLWNLSQSERVKLARTTRKNFAFLQTEIDSLYDEFDKLTKKYPSHPITALALGRINDAIGDAKELLQGDRYVDRIDAFVAAGENPSNSDVVLTLASLRAALERFESVWEATWDKEGLRYGFM